MSRASDLLFYVVKEYLDEHSQYKPDVNVRDDTDIFPKVIVKVERNGTQWLSNDSREIIQGYTCTYDIYAKDTALDTSVTIAEEIESCIYKLMSEELNMKLTFSRPTPNVDNSIYRITMKYACSLREI